MTIMETVRIVLITILSLTTLQHQQLSSTGGPSSGPLLAQAKPVNQNQGVKFRRMPPKEFSATLGSSITIECEAGGSPPPAIHWLKNGVRILQNDLDENQLEDGQAQLLGDASGLRISLSSTRSRLFIDCASFADEATYTCVAENAFSRLATHTTLSLTRPALPVAAQSSGDNDLTIGEELVGELAASRPKGELALAELEAADKSGLAAINQCIGQKLAGDLSEIGLNTVASTEPLRIHMWTHNMLEKMKNNVILYCRSNAKRGVSTSNGNLKAAQSQDNTSSSFPQDLILSNNKLNPKDEEMPQQQPRRQAQVSWTLPTDKLVELSHKDKYEILETGDLLIKDLRWSDMGSYICTISDEQSSDSVSSFVYPTSTKGTSKRAALNQRLVDYR